MKKCDISQWIRLFAMPVLTVVMGLVLLFSPDTASALVGKLLGWVFLLFAVADGFSSRRTGKKQLLRPLLAGIIGLWVLLNPLSVVKMLGRILGLTFVIWGANGARRNYRGSATPAVLAPGIVAAVGAILFLLPMTATRLVLKIAGIVIIAIGTAQVFDRIKGRKRLEGSGDPNIIDVEKV